MRVVHVITGLANGGAESVLYRLCMHDQEVEHVVVSLMDEGKYGPMLTEAGVRVHSMGMTRRGLSASGVLRLWSVLRREQPSIVQTWMYHADLIGGLVARLAGCHHVVWGIRHSTFVEGQSNVRTMRIARVCARLSRLIPTTIVACAYVAARVHVDMGYDGRRMTVVPNGYDLERLRPDPDQTQRLRCEWQVQEGVPLIGMVGRSDPQKNHEGLLIALSRLRRAGHDFRVVLIGPGVTDENEALVSAIQGHGLGDRVRLLGARSDIPGVMSALDLHVLASSFGEAFPNVVAEAMACGTPCVVTDVGDASAIVGEAGWVVPPDDDAALAAAIASALDAMNNPRGWSQLGRACRSRVEQEFDLGVMVERFHAVYGWPRGRCTSE